MKARIPLSAYGSALSKAAKEEIHRQCVEANAVYEFELDALVLWTLRSCYGFGRVRLRRFYETLLSYRKALHDCYTRHDPKAEIGVEYRIATERLSAYGFDVKQQYEEITEKLKTQK